MFAREKDDSFSRSAFLRIEANRLQYLYIYKLFFYEELEFVFKFKSGVVWHLSRSPFDMPLQGMYTEQRQKKLRQQGMAFEELDSSVFSP